MLVPGMRAGIMGGKEMTPPITLAAVRNPSNSAWIGYNRGVSSQQFFGSDGQYGSISAQPIAGLTLNYINTSGSSDNIIEFAGNVLDAIAKWKFIVINGVAYPLSFSLGSKGNTDHRPLTSGQADLVAGTSYQVRFSV